jgi:uncharacterized damage-inducible protein DinB
MSDPKFAEWVEPVAERLEQSKREIEQVVEEIPADAWEQPSAYGGWSFKDQLSHLGDSHGRVQSVLRAILAGQDPDFSQFARIDEINEQNRLNHIDTPVTVLRTSFVLRSDETQNVLSELGAEHADFSLGPMTLEQALNGFAMHDAQHLEELRKALQT